MNISEILTVNNTAAGAHGDSKKSVLELISKLAGANITTLDTKKVFESLVERERLGSTAVGHGVAIPHARISGITKPIAALVQLSKPIAFDAPDDEPVDILFGLLLPEEQPEEHLSTLAALAELLKQDKYRSQLRHAKTNTELFNNAIGNGL